MGEANSHGPGLTEGEAVGVARGRLAAQRELCITMVAKYHPGILDRVTPIIEDSQDEISLKEWALEAADLDDDEFVRMLDQRWRMSSPREWWRDSSIYREGFKDA